MKGKVYLVGAGPGDYKLITLKALECIKNSDVIVYDRLANSNYLKEAKENCEIIYVGKQSNNHTLSQSDINKLILDKAKKGKIVTRLKGGDPYVFGRGGEEGQTLNKEGIEFEVVPGITSAIGGLCYAGIPITHRDYASSFHVITGHLRDDDKENSEINWNALANIKGTLVFLMGVSNLDNITKNLINEGKPKSTPVAIISWATRYNQKVITSTFEDAYKTGIKENVKPPSLIVIGDVVNLRDELNFFENKPLLGKSIVVTRSRTQNSSIVEKIIDLGGNPIEIPTIKINKIENNIELEEEINKIKEYTYLIFTSKNGVEIFFDKLNEMNLDSRALATLKICAIGSATQKELKLNGINADIIPNEYVAESLFNTLKYNLNKYDNILIPRAKGGRDYLIDKLSEICTVKEVNTYETVIDTSKKDEILNILEKYKVEYITFASSSSVRNFVEIIGNENLNKINNCKTISIGPVTSSTAKELNIDIYKQSSKATIDSMIEAIIKD